MSEDSPKIVRLETSLELSDFLSEADFPSETAAQPEPESMPLSALPTVGVSAGDGAALVVPSGPESTLHDDVVVTNHSAIPEPRATVPAPAGPATVTEFPVRPQLPPAVALPTLPTGPVTLIDLIERRGGFDWREAVAVIRQICLHLRDHAPHAPIFLDPRNIQITDRGEVQLLSGQTSSDPLVIQVGRLLRTMLMGKEAPPELRLLLAQATFELPIFESIEDVDRALAQLNKLDEPGPAGLALLRAVATAPTPADDDGIGHRPPSIRAILPAQRGTVRRSRSRTAAQLSSYGSHVAIIFAAIAIVGGLLLTRPAVLFPKSASTTATAAPIVVAPPAQPVAAPVQPAVRTAPEAPPSLPPIHRPPNTGQNHAGVAIARPLEAKSTPEDLPRPGSTPPRPAPTAGIILTPRAPSASATAVPSPRDSERRAASLLALGQMAEASMAFDALVMSTPLYEPRPTDLTPEALAAFRASQRLLLPVIAQRNYDRAVAALAAGDSDRALALAKEAAAILDRRLADTPPRLREQVDDLIEQATAAAAAANEIVYSEADTGVIPPRPLSRQMPINGPLDIPPNRVGWLEMVINRDGGVYSVRLHTPLNRHHERMIVSPAKAWRYRPAMKNGKPVMYRILVKVTLPESGTEF